MRAAVLLLLVALVLSSPGQVAAGPPERVPAKLALDTVANGLRKYRKETDAKERIQWLKRLAPTRDPRVAVALFECLDAPPTFPYVIGSPDPRLSAWDLLQRYYLPPPPPSVVESGFGFGSSLPAARFQVATGRIDDHWPAPFARRAIDAPSVAPAWRRANEADLRRRAKQLPQ